LTGKKPPVEIAGFSTSEETHEAESCPEGHAPIESTYYEKNDTYRVKIDTCHCGSCPNRSACGAKMQKKSAVVTVSAKKVKRAAKLKEMGTDDYALRRRQRNGVEAIPSLLRRNCSAGGIPVMGLRRSRLFFGFKIGALNFKKMLKFARGKCAHEASAGKCA
jgi:hypothetical protein